MLLYILLFTPFYKIGIMKSGNIHVIAACCIVLLSLTGCTINGFNQKEIKIISGGGETDIMPLMTINNKADSLFLRNSARKVAKYNINSEKMQSLKKRMLATVLDSLNRGVGIAAPQVGVGIRMILVQRFDKENEPFEVYYNPKIEEYGDSINSGREGCLSIPGYRGQVNRSQNIKISYTDSLGDKRKETINGFEAVIFQHEIDHLNGVLYFDHVYGGFEALVPSLD